MNDGLTIQVNNESLADLDPVMKADSRIREGKLDEAKALLETVITELPQNWGPMSEDEVSIFYHFWNENEFRAFVDFHKGKVEKNIFWSPISYSKAYYLLAYIAIESQDLESANSYLEKGIAIEPDHPKLLSEKAYVLERLLRDEESLQYRDLALTSRAWLTPLQKMGCLRDKAVTLTNLNRFEEAREILLNLRSQYPEDNDLVEDLAKLATQKLDFAAPSTTGAASPERIVWTSKKLFDPDDWGDVERFCISPDGLFCTWYDPDSWHVANLVAIDFDSEQRKLVHGPMIDEELKEEWVSWHDFGYPEAHTGEVFYPYHMIWSPCGNYLATSALEMGFSVVYSLKVDVDSIVVYDAKHGPWGRCGSKFSGERPFKWDYSSTLPIPVPYFEEDALRKYRLTALMTDNKGEYVSDKAKALVHQVVKNQRIALELYQRSEETRAKLDPYQEARWEREREFLSLHNVKFWTDVLRTEFRKYEENFENEYRELLNEEKELESEIRNLGYHHLLEPTYPQSRRDRYSLSPDEKYILSSFSIHTVSDLFRDGHFNILVLEELPTLKKKRYLANLPGASMFTWGRNSNALFFIRNGKLGRLSIQGDGKAGVSLTGKAVDRIVCNPAFDIVALMVKGTMSVPDRIDMLNSEDLSVIESQELGICGMPELQWSRDGKKLWLMTNHGIAFQAELSEGLLKHFV